jgi:hypothetical protein
VILHLKLVLAVESSSSTLVTLEAWLLDGYRLPLSYHLVWKPRKICITILCDSEQLKVVFVTS